MKLLMLFIIVGCLQVSAKSFSQQVTLSAQNTSLKTIFKEIEKQTGFLFLYDKQLLSSSKPVSVSLNNVPLSDALRICLKDQKLAFNIEEKTIVISSVAGSSDRQHHVADVMWMSPPFPVKIRVTDADGKPLSGASIINKKSGKTGVTDAEGVSSFDVSVGDVLSLSFVGYDNLSITIKDNSSFVTATLQIKISSLDETVVIAYGTTTRRLSTGNVTSIKASDIEKQPVNNPLLALQGRVPGLFITQSTGLPGSGVIVRIQGQNSISKGNDPLYVIDGIPYSFQLLPTLNSILGTSGYSPNPTGSGNPLSFINPSDIESIDVLKDADATAIYGSRAANGAILITTKKGRAGQTKLDVNMQSGWGKITRKLSLLNTQQYLQMRNEAFKNDGTTPQSWDYDLNLWDTTRSTDWQKELIGGTAKYTNIQLTVSGGNSTTQFSVGSNYHKETTVFPGNLADQKGSVHFNINNFSVNQKFRLQVSGNYITDNNLLQFQDLTSTAIYLTPNAPPIFNTDGSLNWAPDTSGVSTWINPLAHQYLKYKNKTNNLIGTSLISYKILPGLDIKSSFGYTNLQSNEFQAASMLNVAPEERPNTIRSAQFGNSTINTWVIEPQATFKMAIGKGKIETLIGSTFQQNKNNLQQLTATGFNSDLVLEDIKSATNVTVGTTISSVYKYNALFTRLNYNFQDKYIINLTARRDGSSRFGSKSQVHNFGSLAGAWIFSSEKFIKKVLPFISFGKLKASYGITGNDQIGDYQFLNLYSPFSVAVPYGGAIGLRPIGLSNPYLHWEETKKLQFGLDLGILSDHILVNVNYFINRSSNQLLSYGLPIITGFPNVSAVNFPATVQNSGLELSFNTVDFRIRDLSWSSNINLTVPKNKLVAFENLATSSYASGLSIGKPITLINVYHLLEVDPTSGLYLFADKNGNNTSSPDASMDKTVMINTSPKFYGGFQNTFRFKSFELDILFQFVKQLGQNYLFGNFPGSGNANQPTSVLNRWQKNGDIASIQRYSESNFSTIFLSGNAAGSDAAWSDASYIRLKNLSLSWQIPDEWRKRAHLQNCRLYVQGQNILTFTNYLGLDPENRSVSSLPPLRVMTLGLQVTL